MMRSKVTNKNHITIIAFIKSGVEYLHIITDSMHDMDVFPVLPGCTPRIVGDKLIIHTKQKEPSTIKITYKSESIMT